MGERYHIAFLGEKVIFMANWMPVVSILKDEDSA